MRVTAAELLAASGRFPIAAGLTVTELDAIEREFGFTFAPDHRAFLAAGVPTGRGWPDWRDPDRTALRDRLAWPIEGVLFDVAENSFWYEGWGPHPVEDAAAAAVARRYLMTVPRMVPVFAHRYLPGGPQSHPVLSIYQTDVVYYGADLDDWLYREFGLGVPSPDARPVTVGFWRELT
jgi:hypothetical protein